MRVSRRAVIAGSGAALLAGPMGLRTIQAAQGATLVAIVQPEPSVLTSAVNNAAPQGIVSTNVLEGLLEYGDKGELLPCLATSWETSGDGLSITFKLRSNVRWHDGQPFTSADVSFSIMEVLKKYHSRARLNLASVQSVDTPDAHTAILRLSQPSPVLIKALNASDGQILPRHLYEGKDILTNPNNAKPIGTGAFVFKEWRRGEHITLERNPNYWATDKPQIQKLIFRIIPDAAARAAALEKGDVQYAPYDPLPFSDISRIKSLPNLAVSTHGYDYISHMLSMEFNLRRPYVSDVRVRRAIAHAIDRRKLTDTVWYGFGRPAISIIPSTLPAFHTLDVPKYAYDVEKANKILDEAGYPRKSDGMRFKLSHSYLPFNEAFRRNAEFIRQNLKDVGIETTIDNVDLATYVRKVFTNYDFDLNSTQLACGIDPEIGITRYLWSQAIRKGVPWTNASGYANPVVDKLIEGQKRELNEQKRVEAFHKIQKTAQTDLPLLPLMAIVHVTVYSTRISGLNKAPDAALASLKDLSLSSS